ncbi:MAG: adenylate/guanylate cyclase domain-containing protein, partial [Chloroflexi bacterium]|nr:adenylate/guanylate cyclase domain-containing protein [Chloroflexota bacterium]
TYTCIGDTVNVASRLEAHTKVLAEPILIDARTREGLPDSIRVEERGSVQVKGRTHPVQLFSVSVPSEDGA